MFLDALEDSWPQSPQASLARRILPDLMRLGPVRLTANADVELRAWQAGDQVLPIVLRKHDGASRIAAICSPWLHYVRYPLGELDRHGRGFGALFRRGLLYASIPFLRVSNIDQVVWVNNWLITTNPQPTLDRAEIERLTDTLRKQYPRHAIVFRTVNPEVNQEFATDLVACGYRLVASRTVYLLDPASREYRRNKDVRLDRNLLHRGDYEILPHEALSPADMPRVAELHRLLYMEKHSVLNADYSPLFFETAWRNRFLEFRALRRQGRIDAYTASFALGDLMTACLVGYDTRLPRKLGLYRRSIALIMEESRRNGLRLNLSAGAGEFKYHRGARPCVEYDAVFDRHLPLHRRAGWSLLKAAGSYQDRKVRRKW